MAIDRSVQFDFQVLGALDIDEVYNFADRRLKEQEPDEHLRMFASWQARWRRESLDHYLKLGWSFIARRNNQAVGFFLGQPFLFFRGQTQTLWVEHVEAAHPDVFFALIDVAIQIAREKHLQRVLFDESEFIESQAQLAPQFADSWRKLTSPANRSVKPLTDSIVEIKTTKG